jgi:oligosaccharide repeat unit polymerase
MMGFVDVLWLVLFLLTGLGALLGSLRLFGHWFTPLSLLVCINCASVCAYHLRLLGMKDVSAATHLVLLSCLLAYALGCAAAVRRRPPPPEAVLGHLDTRGLVAFFHITAAIATVGWMTAAFILITRRGGIGMLLAHLWMLQDEFQMQGIGYMNMLGILVLPAFVLKRACGLRGRFDVPLVLSALFGLLLAGIKGFVFYSALTALVTWSLARPDRFRPRHLAVTGAVLLGFFVIYNSKVDIFVSDIVTAGNGWFASVPQLHWPYLYFVGAWPAMQNILDGQVAPPAIAGAVTLNAIWKPAGDLLGLVDSVPFALPFTDIGATLFNVYSMFGILYQEWTWPGAVAICGLLGFVGTRLYLRARWPGYWGHVLVYALFAYGLFMSCFMYVYRFNEAVLMLYLYGLGFVLLRGGVLVDRRRHE